VVQVGAFADADKARETRLKVERAGLKTYTHVAETKEGKRIRVRVGPLCEQGRGRPRHAEKIKGLDLPCGHPHLVGRAVAASTGWVFVAVLVASLLLGAWRGLVYEVLSVA
jgi:hypothetical protein